MFNLPLRGKAGRTTVGSPGGIIVSIINNIIKIIIKNNIENKLLANYYFYI